MVAKSKRINGTLAIAPKNKLETLRIIGYLKL